MQAGTQEETLRLEGFSESLRSHRSYCVAPNPKFAEPFLRGRMAALDAEVAHRGRRVLVVQGTLPPPSWALKGIAWDAVFHVRDTADLKLALTHIQHATRPTRVVWMGGDPAPAVLTAVSRMEGLTFLGVGEKAPTSDAWEAIFWAPSATAEEVEPAIVVRMGASGLGGLRTMVKELRASDVGLVWSSIGEAERRGGLYWYDPTEGVDAARQHMDMAEAADILRSVADMISR